MMTIARELWVMQIGTMEPRKLGERVEPSIQRSQNFVNSTCAAGDRETPCFEVVMLLFSLSNS